MNIRKAIEQDLKQLLDIYNYEVIQGISTFDLQPKAMEAWKEWFQAHNVEHHPLIVAEVDNRAAGYACLSPYRPKAAYASTVELSVYVDPSYRGQGVATSLMGEIIRMARECPDIHTVVSVITAGNSVSVRLHEKFGFICCGTLREVGKKFGAFRDIVNYQLFVS